MSAEPSHRGVRPSAAVALVVLLAAGIVVVSSSAVDYPDSVVLAAHLVALVVLLTAVISTWRASRSAGVSWCTSLWRSIKAAGRFMLDLFF